MYGGENPRISVKSGVSKCTDAPPREWVGLALRARGSRLTPRRQKVRGASMGFAHGRDGDKSPRPD